MRRPGFTLIELITVVVLLGLLWASMMARSVNLGAKARDSTKLAMAGAVKTAHAMYIYELMQFPNVTQLSGRVIAGDISAEADGIRVMIDGLSYTVPTYTDEAGTILTTSVSDEVRCVGEIPES
jgi:MSHA pilin protein MshA